MMCPTEKNQVLLCSHFFTVENKFFLCCFVLFFCIVIMRIWCALPDQTLSMMDGCVSSDPILFFSFFLVIQIIDEMRKNFDRPFFFVFLAHN